MRHILKQLFNCCLFILFILLIQSVADAETAGGQAPTGIYVTGIQRPPDIFVFKSIPVDMLPLPGSVPVNTSNTRCPILAMPVTWDINELDLNTAGAYQLNGIIQTTPGVTNNTGELASINLMVVEFPPSRAGSRCLPWKKVDPYKQWTIKFNSAVNTSEPLSDKVVIIDAKGRLVPINPRINASSADEIIVDCPIGGYDPNNTYYLRVLTNLKNNNGWTLSQEVCQPFVISRDMAVNNNGEVINLPQILASTPVTQSIQYKSPPFELSEDETRQLVDSINNYGIPVSQDPGREAIQLPKSHLPVSMMGLSPGNLILTSAIPGLCMKTLYRVTSNNSEVLSIEQPPLDECLDGMRFDAQIPVTPSNIINKHFIEGVELETPSGVKSKTTIDSQTARPIAIGSQYPCSLNLGSGSYENQIQISISDEADIGVKGKIAINNALVTMQFYAFNWGQDDKIGLNFSGEIEESLEFSGELAEDVDWTKVSKSNGPVKIKDASNKDQIILGYFDVAYPALDAGVRIYLALNCEGEVSAQLAYEESVSRQVNMGLDYTKPWGFTLPSIRLINNVQPVQSSRQIAVSGQADAKLRVGTGCGLVVLGQVPAIVQTNANLNANITASGSYDLDTRQAEGGIEGSISSYITVLARAGLSIWDVSTFAEAESNKFFEQSFNFTALDSGSKVQFSDPALELAIREVLQRPIGVITEKEARKIPSLNLSNKGIRDLTGIDKCTNLTYLDLRNNEISNIEPLKYLTGLTALYLGGNPITDYQPTSSYYSNLIWKDFTLDQTDGIVSGQVTNALTGEGVGGIRIDFRLGENNTTGTIVRSVITSSDGFYSLSLPSGTYCATTVSEAYSRGIFKVISLAGQSNPNQNTSISPKLMPGITRIVLTWGEEPWDLDSHLTGPKNGSSSRFHVYFGNRFYDDIVNLDHDDITSYGPETITINNQIDGVYRYSVHDYTNRYSTDSYGLARSGARVMVYRGDVPIAKFDVPNQMGNLWTVFEMQGNTITPVNTISNNSSASYIQKTKN